MRKYKWAMIDKLARYGTEKERWDGAISPRESKTEKSLLGEPISRIIAMETDFSKRYDSSEKKKRALCSLQQQLHLSFGIDISFLVALLLQ